MHKNKKPAAKTDVPAKIVVNAPEKAPDVPADERVALVDAINGALAEHAALGEAKTKVREAYAAQRIAALKAYVLCAHNIGASSETGNFSTIVLTRAGLSTMDRAKVLAWRNGHSRLLVIARCNHAKLFTNQALRETVDNIVASTALSEIPAAIRENKETVGGVKVKSLLPPPRKRTTKASTLPDMLAALNTELDPVGKGITSHMFDKGGKEYADRVLNALVTIKARIESFERAAREHARKAGMVPDLTTHLDAVSKRPASRRAGIPTA